PPPGTAGRLAPAPYDTAPTAPVSLGPPLRCTVDGVDGCREAVEACLEAIVAAAAILVADVEPAALAKHPVQFGRHAVVGVAAVGTAVGDRGVPLAGVVDPDGDSRRQEAAQRNRHQQQRVLAAEGIAGGDLEQHAAAALERECLADVATPGELSLLLAVPCPVLENMRRLGERPRRGAHRNGEREQHGRDRCSMSRTTFTGKTLEAGGRHSVVE